VIASAVGLVAVGTGNLPLFDRYALGLVPFAAGLVLAHRTTSRRPTGSGGPTPPTPPGRSARRAAEVVAVVVFALLGLWWSADSAAFDAARWRAGEQAEALGYPADRIDAGFEWRNAHRAAGATPTAPSEHDADACVRVESDADGSREPAADTEVLFTVDLGRPFRHTGPLRVVSTGAAGCPTIG
jgi:hypothetical protein